MSDPLLATAWRTETLVSREDELKRIEQTIYRVGNSCQIVLVQGVGGIGKTRLLEEVLWRIGNPNIRKQFSQSNTRQQREREDWISHGSVIASDLIDLSDIRLSTRTQFLRSIRDALDYPNGADFSGYDAAFLSQQRALERGADYASVQNSVQKAEERFLEEYRRNASERRIVLALDTAENLALLPTSTWLLEQEILKPSDLFFSTQQWLLVQIEKGNLENTTLIIAGRDAEHEGGPFFKIIKDICNKSSTTTSLTVLKLEPLNTQDTIKYFLYLAGEWRERKNSRMAEAMEWLIEDEDRINVLHLYTGGKPVLLSLYAALVFESPSIPESLMVTMEQAEVLVQEQGLQQVRANIEREFIKLLFVQPGLRSAILQALVRARRGLDALQLHFVIDSTIDQDLAEWTSDTRRLDEINKQLEMAQLRSLSIIKSRPDGRIGLQDEIYRIYAERMGEDEDNRNDERDSRQVLYTKLLSWAEFEQQGLEKQRREFQEDDERRLQIFSPARALSTVFPLISDVEQRERSVIHLQIRNFELERMHYALLLDPSSNLNNVYFDLAERWWRANDEDADLSTQIEMWRSLYDDYALKFVNITEARKKTMRYAAQHDDATRWIKRFILRGDYKRAIEFCDQIEVMISQIVNMDERRRWLHTLARGERAIWRAYAQIMLGDKVSDAVQYLSPYLADLAQLANHDIETVVFPERWNGENGFIRHPALPRLHRAIAIGFNFIGYGYAVLGQFRQSAINYGKALYYMRETAFRGQQAATRNNLGRALSELGRHERGRRVCIDGLALRREQGADVPIAYSINTLALIDNDMRRPDLAWVEAAKAVAYFRRAEMNRGVGLALLELSKALRRKANGEQSGLVLEDPPDRIYAEAERAAEEAIIIFSDSSAKAESPRLIEALIELACVKRDQIPLLKIRSQKQAQRYTIDAINHFKRAKESAERRGLTRHALDATVNMAWAYYYASDIENTKQTLLAAEDLIDTNYLLQQGSVPPKSGQDKSYMFEQLSKMYNLRGVMEIEQFEAKAEEISRSIADRKKRQILVHNNKIAQSHLRSAAIAFVQALCYAELFSPRSVALALSYNHIYRHLKKFNIVELEDFRRYQRIARKTYKVTKVEIEDFSDLNTWIEDCFGPERENVDIIGRK